MVSRYGLSELYAPPNDGIVTAQHPYSIIFVHGLFGHPRKTWAAKKKPSKSPRPSSSKARAHQHSAVERPQNSASQSPQPSTGKNHRRKSLNNEEGDTVYWPQALLSTVIPDVKIFSYGYDADIDGFLSSAGQNTIHQHAESLLSDLSDLRSSHTEQEIPIIFVCHSLGGIVVKDALNQSASTVGTRLKTILPATFGICFLGTPHRGSKSASMGKIAYNCTILYTKRPNLKLLQGLERNSETLDRVGSAFSQTLLKHPIAIYSFREEKEMRKFIIFNTLVVNADSAKIGDGREEIGSIPANHSNMTKFQRATDIGFRRVSAQLRRWVEEIRVNQVIPTQDRKDRLSSLNIAALKYRFNDVREAHEKTFHWLFDPAVVSFRDWLKNQGPDSAPIYWIQGKPGSGKSTLMKFALRDKRATDSLNAGNTTAWTIAAFFFHDRGSEKQKSLTGMLQNLLGSILGQLPSLDSFVIPFYLGLLRAQRTRSPTWDLETLKDAMLSIVKQRKFYVRIMLVLDALDEHHGDNELLAALLKKLADSADNHWVRLKLCLASRSWTIFEQQFGHCPGFAIHNHTHKDIRTYIESRVNLGTQILQSSNDRSGLLRIVDLVARRALGVWIWVRLVMDLISKGIRDGTPYETLEAQVERMPQELKALYADTLRRIDQDYSSEAYIMLQVALCSLVPLPVDLFMASVDMAHSAKFVLNMPIEPPIGNLVSQKSRLTSRSGGLLELTSTLHATEDEVATPVVQFIHQTVREYFLTVPRDELGLFRHPSDQSNEDGNMFLVRSCVAQNERMMLVKRDLFLYASRAMRSNQDKKAEINGLIERALLVRGDSDLEWFLNQRSGSLYKNLQEKVVTDDRRRTVLSMLAVAEGFPEYVTVGNTDLALDVCLHIAAAGFEFGGLLGNSDNRKAIKHLLDVGYSVDARSSWILPHIPLEPALTRFRLGGALTALGVALLVDKISAETRFLHAKELLEAGAYPDTAISSDGLELTPLQLCVCQRNADTVRLLLQYGADANVSTNGWDLLHLAFLRGDQAIIQVLLDGGLSGKPIQNESEYATVKSLALTVGLSFAAPTGGISWKLARSMYHLDFDTLVRTHRQQNRDEEAPSSPDPDASASTYVKESDYGGNSAGRGEDGTEKKG